METVQPTPIQQFATNTTKLTLLPFHRHLPPTFPLKIPFQPQQAVLDAKTRQCVGHGISPSRERDLRFKISPLRGLNINIDSHNQNSIFGRPPCGASRPSSEIFSTSQNQNFSAARLDHHHQALKSKFDFCASAERRFRLSFRKFSSRCAGHFIVINANIPFGKFEISPSRERRLNSMIFSSRCAGHLDITNADIPAWTLEIRVPATESPSSPVFSATFFFPLRGAQLQHMTANYVKVFKSTKPKKFFFSARLSRQEYLCPERRRQVHSTISFKSLSS
ncbi:hypothetical protein R3P38DRAFT_3291955 [Favolaschia claudopus]|uniref:Ribosomal protein L5 n=1 Tax=Favolaschia claudopus TaxID=2862362 RepID=A0AAV9ZMJ2_9AGAR